MTDASIRLSEGSCLVCKEALTHALKLGHNYIEPEHLLLALIDQEGSVTARALIRLGIEPADLRKAVLDALSKPRCEHCGW